MPKTAAINASYSRTFVATVAFLVLFSLSQHLKVPIPESSLNVAIGAFGFKEGMSKLTGRAA